MENLLMGIGLSSSTGYKAFIPLVIISIASKLEMIQLTDSSQWIGSTLFLSIVVLFSILEFLSSSIPVVGRIFDLLGIPITLVCGYIALTSLTGNLVENNMIVKHIIGILLGAGSAGVIKALNLIKNTFTDTLTFGVSGPLNSIKDTIIAVFISILAIVSPLLVSILLLLLLFMSYKVIRKLRGWKAFKYPKRLEGSNG